MNKPLKKAVEIAATCEICLTEEEENLLSRQISDAVRPLRDAVLYMLTADYLAFNQGCRCEDKACRDCRLRYELAKWEDIE